MMANILTGDFATTITIINITRSGSFSWRCAEYVEEASLHCALHHKVHLSSSSSSMRCNRLMIIIIMIMMAMIKLIITCVLEYHDYHDQTWHHRVINIKITIVVIIIIMIIIMMKIIMMIIMIINNQYDNHHDNDYDHHHDLRRGITESSPELADVLYQFPAHQQSKLLQVITVMMVVVN